MVDGVTGLLLYRLAVSAAIRRITKPTEKAVKAAKALGVNMDRLRELTREEDADG